METTINIKGCSGVYIGSVGELLPQLVPAGRTIVITDTNIDRLYHDLVAQYGDCLMVGLGEQSKTLVTAERLYNELIDRNADRNTFILAIGGGIVTDVAGYVATTYMRGMHFGFVPTTLLAQVDASVGGKNGVNVKGYKNMVGTFSQPQFVVCDMSMLSTLSDREFRTGLAEIIKAAIIADKDLFDALERTTFADLRKDKELLSRIVEASIRVKADIVEQDEKESGVRRYLNLGHTLAHAIEKSISSHNHGEAVAIGLKYIALCGEKMGVLSDSDCKRICVMLDNYGFDTSLPVEAKTLIMAMRKDKKHEGEKLHLVVPETIGCVRDLLLSQSEVEQLFLDILR